MVKEKSRFKVKKEKNEDGFVLITALMVIFLIVTIVTSVALVTAQDLRAAARARAIITTRLMAESVSDAVYATIAKETSGYEIAARTRFSNNGVLGSTAQNPLLSPNPNDYGRWFRLLTDGSLVTCDVRVHMRETCFKAKIETPSGPLARETVQLTVVARGGCIVVNGSPITVRNCVYRKYTQVYQTRSFVDTAQITNSEIPAGFPGASGIYIRPSGLPFPVAYLPSDKINGDVFSNDNVPTSGFYFCGDTSGIQQDIYSGFQTNNPQYDPLPLGAGDCTSSSAFSSALSNFKKFLPSQISKAGSSQDIRSTPANVFFDLAGGNSPSPYNLTGPVAITLDYGTIQIGSNAPIPYPSNGVIYVAGEISSLSGRFSRSLSIVATGDIKITDNIVYASAASFASNQNGSSIISGDSLLGILSGANIKLEQCTLTPACLNRNIVATLSAPFGTIYNESWNTAANPDYNNPPRVTVYGTIIANSRPVFGSFYARDDVNPTAPDGAIQFGWAKTITLDRRLTENQPPYFFRTSQASVTRNGLESDSCNDPICKA